MEPYEREIEREELAQRIRAASLKTCAETERAAADFDAANADGLWMGRDTQAPAL
jgi:hypothetical protein